MSDSYRCKTCQRSHRMSSAIGVAHAAPVVVAPVVLPDKCPVCGGALYTLKRHLYCPAEDPHAGGLFIGLDGIVYQRVIIRTDGGEAA